ncbi:serine hydrolase domain-containing protein [Aquimarina litoralis]|uniref:serine hydrolase domain-containing protein n=1 Tax=Aquimarina litoralis TaxID=584605 RepID=UPI001C587D3C|nr:serine hydrolase domain-containing protein [Aquimarina litoralis]MBW1294808.1 serine hydrolase [Aquimarina litoralis]
MKTFHLILLLFILFCNISFSQSANNFDFSPVEKEIQTALNTKEIPSIVVAVSKNGKIIYEKAFGYSDMEHKIKATVTTSYQLASVSKVFTATGMMLLQHQKKIDIHAPAEKYMADLKFKEVDGISSEVKVIDLLNHTSGLGTYFQLHYGDESTKSDSFQNAFKKYGSLFHPAGQVYEYSNLGYGLLDYIIEVQSGTTFSSFVEKELFNPLRLKNTFVHQSNKNNIQIAKKYDANLNVLPEIKTNTKGAGDVYSSIHDLISFGMFHIDNNDHNILSANERLLMRNYKNKNVLYPNYDESFYGFGWNIKPNDHNYNIVWHEGGMMGVSSMLKLIPDEDIAIAVIQNVYNPTFCQKITNMLSKIVLPEYHPAPINPVADYTSYTSNPSYFGKWKGDIKIDALSIPCTLTFKDNGDIIMDYLDYTYQSYFTQNNPIPNKTFLAMGLVNKNSFLGMYPGDLPSEDIRHEFSQFLSLKLIKEGNILSGIVVALAASEREYYAYPYYIKFQKE